MKLLNLGCGEAKIPGAINVDMSEKVKPDVVYDIGGPLPFGDGEFDKVYFFHCIEHLERYKHQFVLNEIHRVMKLDGILYISYPEFEKIIRNWLDNLVGKRDFWEATIYGRQLYPGDYHFSAIKTLELKELLFNAGFNVFKEFSEPTQDFNTVLHARRGPKLLTYEEQLYQEVFAK